MSTRFIGNGNGLVLTCNHGDVWLTLDADGTGVFPPRCGEKLTTGQILCSGIRAYAETQKWTTVEIDGRKRDFCHLHSKERTAWLKNRKSERERAAKEKRDAREAKERERRDAWLAKQRQWKAKREEKAARSAAWHEKRAAKRAASEVAAP